MTSADLLNDAFERVRRTVHLAVSDLTPEQLAYRPDADANSIAWLVWHLTRIQDDHIADAAGIPQVWTSAGWDDRFGLPFDQQDTGYGHDTADVAAVAPESGEHLIGYHDAVHDQTISYVRDLTDADLPRIVDERWDPPVTLGVRLVSVIGDNMQHAGQAAYVRGLVERR
ncbi:MAG: mycothiol transferase [Nocardioidaceae bacterium]